MTTSGEIVLVIEDRDGTFPPEKMIRTGLRAAVLEAENGETLLVTPVADAPTAEECLRIVHQSVRRRVGGEA